MLTKKKNAGLMRRSRVQLRAQSHSEVQYSFGYMCKMANCLTARSWSGNQVSQHMHVWVLNESWCWKKFDQIQNLFWSHQIEFIIGLSPETQLSLMICTLCLPACATSSPKYSSCASLWWWDRVGIRPKHLAIDNTIYTHEPYLSV